MKVQFEHANIHVSDVNRMLEFLQQAFPDWKVRHDSGADDTERWVHFGDDDFYLSVYQATRNEADSKVPYDGNPGINHLGFVVGDTDAVRHRLLASGFRESTIENQHPARRRVYFNDDEGNDWEFVQYFSEDPLQRNDYLHEIAQGLSERV